MHTPPPETPAEYSERLLQRAQAQAMASADKLSLMIAVTDNPQDAMALNRELARAHRSLRQSALVAARIRAGHAEPLAAAPRQLLPDARDREITLRRHRMTGALNVRLEREVPDEDERTALEEQAEAWFDTEAVDEAFVTDLGPAQMARLVAHLGLPARPADDDAHPPAGVTPLRPRRQGSG